MTNAPPSTNPANEGHLLGAFRQVLDKFLNGVDDMLPAVVIAFDRDTNRASVRPLINVVTTAGERVQRAPVASVPVFQIGAGGFMLNFNLIPGDIGFIKANDRDISIFMQTMKEASPNTARKHSFEDAIFFPATLNGFTIAEEDAENVVLQTKNGNHRVAIWNDRVKITSTELIVLEAPEVHVNGELGANEIRCQTLYAENDVIVIPGTISLRDHVHGGVTPGSGQTGEPVES